MAYIKQQERRDNMLTFIRDYISEHNESPTLRELQNGLGWSSTSVVGHYLTALQAEGKVEIEFGKTRGITLTDFPHGRYTDLVNAAHEAAMDEENKGSGSIYNLIVALEQIK